MALLLGLLLAAPGLAAERDEADDLFRQAAAVLAETRALDAQLKERGEQVFAIDPTGEHAADALPLLAEGQVIIGTMMQRAQFLSTLWARVGALDVSEETTTYADQQYFLAQKYLAISGVGLELLERYAMVYDPDARAQLSAAERRRIVRRITDLGARDEELYAQFMQMSEESQRYFNEHDVGLADAGGRSWVVWAIRLGIASASALACGVIARKKNRSVIGWGVFGFVIPLAALIAAAAVRRVELAPGSAPPPPRVPITPGQS